VCNSLSSVARDFMLAGVIVVECGFVVLRPESSMDPSTICLCLRCFETSRMRISIEESASALITRS
jgi:hypothetical protein